MSIVPIVLPVTGGSGHQPGGVTWEPTCVPSIESQPLADGVGCTAAIFGYLSDIWCRTVHPLSIAVDDPIPMRGSGEFQYATNPIYPFLAKVEFELVPPAPLNTDLVFGEIPIYYLGVFGFGVVDTVTAQFNAGPFLLQGGVSVGRSRKLPPTYINHLSNIAFAPHPQTNVFWWHLKEGVTGQFVPYAIDYGLGATANPNDAAQSWAPSFGGWCQTPPSPFGQVFDGCGLPACH